MLKILHRIIIFCLLPTLITDPLWATWFSPKPSFTVSVSQYGYAHSPWIDGQALSLREIAIGQHPGHITDRIYRILGPWFEKIKKISDRFILAPDPTGALRLHYSPGYEPAELLADVVIVRHGETDGNKREILQGNVNGPENQLNEHGRRQAVEAAERLFTEFETLLRTAPEQIVILESPLQRAKDTRQAFTDLVWERLKIKLFAREIEQAREIDFGAWDGLSMEEILLTLGPAEAERVAIYRKNHPRVTGEGGQTFFDYTMGPTRELIDEINREYAGKTVFLFSHGSQGNSFRVQMGDPYLVDEHGAIDWRSKKYMLPNATPFHIRRYSSAERKAILEERFKTPSLGSPRELLTSG